MNSSKLRLSKTIAFASFLATYIYGQGVLAQGLTDSDVFDQYANDVERAAAQANQATFEALNCDPTGFLDQNPNPSAPPTRSGMMPCSNSEFTVYLTIRELIHTANELTGSGPTIASLNLDQEGLGTSLRWTAAEELAVQGSMATQFSNSQISNLTARLNALRFGATGFSIAGVYDPTGRDADPVVASLDRESPRGGGASADYLGANYSRWGGFVNGAFGWGSKKPTGREDAFDYDGSEVTLGLDYRLPNNIVVGGIFGYGEQTVDFNEGASTISVVDGGVEAEATSGILFGMYAGENWSGSLSLGLQTLDYDVERNIKYSSFNPNIESASSTARSTPSADVVTATFGLRYAFRINRLTIEPYIKGEFLDVKIDRFSEQRSTETSTGQPDDDAFNLTIAEQNFESLDTALGLKFQLPFTPRFGVIVPYATIEFHSESESDSRIISAGYGSADTADVFDQASFQFAIPTDELDDSYYTWSAGFSTVLRGGRQRTADGPVTGGLMAFVQYLSIESLQNYEDQVVTGGFRYEF